MSIPPLSTDVRRKLVSRIKELGEEAKVAIRNVRRDGNKAADQAQKDKDLTEDDCDNVKEEIQALKDSVDETLRKYVELARRLGWNAGSATGTGIDPADEITRVCMDLAKQYQHPLQCTLEKA